LPPSFRLPPGYHGRGCRQDCGLLYHRKRRSASGIWRAHRSPPLYKDFITEPKVGFAVSPARRGLKCADQYTVAAVDVVMILGRGGAEGVAVNASGGPVVAQRIAASSISFIGNRGFVQAAYFTRFHTASMTRMLSDFTKLLHCHKATTDVAAGRPSSLTPHKIAACCISWHGAQRAAFGVPTAASALQGFHHLAQRGHRHVPRLSCPERPDAR